MLKMLKENDLSFNDLSNLLQYKEFSEKLNSENKRLRERIIKLNAEKSELALAQSNSNATEDMLNIEQQKSQYLEKTAKGLLEELSKNQTASRDDMLAPLRQAPAFLNTNGLSLYNDSDEMKWLENIRTKAEGNGLYFTKRQLFAYHTAQKIRGMSPLVVLAGISGTGKSELPKNYALYGGMNFLSIPVKPDWDSPASLFGYYNSIEKRFEASELLRAIYQMGSDLSHKDQMLMVLLDEMNLAHPEQYFADILSKLETSRGYGVAEYDILLGGGEKPEKIAIGSNILWTGTMNEDETTKGLSDKVIDRSTLITFPRPKELRSRMVSDSATQKLEFVLPRSTWNGWLNNKRTDNSGIFQETIDSYRQAVQNIKMLAIEKGRQVIKAGKYESDLFDCLKIYCNNKNVFYRRNLLKKFTENINNSLTEDILSGFSKSRAFEMISGFLLKTDATIFQRVVDILWQVSFSIKGFLSNLGSLYLLAKQNNKIKELLHCFYKDFKSEYYIAASRCLYGNQSVMKKVASRIDEDITKTDKSGNNIFGKTLRNISGVCWYNRDWILKLYEVDHLLIKKIEQYLYGYFEQFYNNMQSGCDQRKITELRDIVEVAIALCRLREEDKTIFAPERKETKSLVEIFKEINNYLIDNQNLKMKSRIKFDYKGRVNKVCYLAITMFSGEGNINLLGFSED